MQCVIAAHADDTAQHEEQINAERAGARAEMADKFRPRPVVRRVFAALELVEARKYNHYANGSRDVSICCGTQAHAQQLRRDELIIRNSKRMHR